MSTGGDSHNLDGPLRRIVDLEGQLRAANSESMKRKQLNRDLKARVAELEGQVTTLQGDVTKWRGQVEAQPDEVQQENDRLKAELRKRDHLSAWRDVVGPQLHPKATVEKIWGEIQHTPGESVPTRAQIEEQVARAKEAASYLFKDGGESPPEAQHGQEQGAPPAQQAQSLSTQWDAGRGQSGAGGSNGRTVKVRKSDLQNPRWVLAPQNRKLLQEAQAAGTLEVIDA